MLKRVPATSDHGSARGPSREAAFVQLLKDVAVASNQASSVDDAFLTTIRLVCAHTSWPVGHVYMLSEDGSQLVPTTLWHLDDAERFRTFVDVTEATRLPIGKGLPGRTLLDNKPAWIVDVTADDNFPRSSQAVEMGVRAGFAFPVMTGSTVGAVLEFFSPDPLEPDEPLLDVMGHIGAQLGRVLERERAEAALRESGQRFAEAYEREREASERLRSLDEMKNSFLSAVSHELRTPLTSVVGFSTMLRDRGDRFTPEERADFIRRIALAAEKLERLLTDLLDLDRLSRGVIEPRKRPTDVYELACRVALESGQWRDGAIDVTGERLVAEVDAPHVERIIENLLANAFKHTPEGTRVQVNVGAIGEHVVIDVIDEGMGIPAGMRQTIFQPFVRGDTFTPGTGIGLSLVQRFAELHGGRAWVDTGPDGGAAFHVSLPGVVDGHGTDDPSGDTRRAT